MQDRTTRTDFVFSQPKRIVAPSRFPWWLFYLVLSVGLFCAIVWMGQANRHTGCRQGVIDATFELVQSNQTTDVPAIDPLIAKVCK